jgi:PHD/YefM family antitoxin component YafN of YafNO toxin-antitoxin module
MTRPQSVSEAATVYGTAVADLQHPIILQQEGHPLAVIVAFDEYQHLRALAVDETQRQQAGWQSLEALLKDVHQRPSDCAPEQIEAEIGLARTEVKQARHDRSGH